MKTSIIRATGQVCNIRNVPINNNATAFNLQKAGGLVTTLVKSVFEDGRAIVGEDEVFEGDGAIEFVVKDSSDLICDGTKVVFTCSEAEAENVRKGNLTVNGEITIH